MKDTSKKDNKTTSETGDAKQEQTKELVEPMYMWPTGLSNNVNTMTCIAVVNALVCVASAAVRSLNESRWMDSKDVGIACGVFGFMCWGHMWWHLIAPQLMSARGMWRRSALSLAIVGVLMIPIWHSVMVSPIEDLLTFLMMQFWIYGVYIAINFGSMYGLYKWKARRGQGFFEYCNTEKKL